MNKNDTAIHQLNARKLAARVQKNLAARKATYLLLSCFFIQGQSNACVKPGRAPYGAAVASHAERGNPTVNPDYFRSSDNPFFGD